MDPFTGIESGSINYEKSGNSFFLPFGKNDSREPLCIGDIVSFQMPSSLQIVLVNRPKTNRKGHEFCRKSLCIFCGRKCRENRTIFGIPSLADNLRIFFDLESPIVQVGICNSCRLNQKFRKNLEKRDIFQFDFDFIVIFSKNRGKIFIVKSYREKLLIAKLS